MCLSAFTCSIEGEIIIFTLTCAMLELKHFCCDLSSRAVSIINTSTSQYIDISSISFGYAIYIVHHVYMVSASSGWLRNAYQQVKKIFFLTFSQKLLMVGGCPNELCFKAAVHFQKSDGSQITFKPFYKYVYFVFYPIVS